MYLSFVMCLIEDRHTSGRNTWELYGAYKFRQINKISPITGPRGPEGSRKLWFPYYLTMGQDGGKIVGLMNRPLLPPRNAPSTHFC